MSLRGVQGIKLYYDNERPHVQKYVSNYLESEGITIIPHRPNSPDLLPCDFRLFDLIKQNLIDQNSSELYELSNSNSNINVISAAYSHFEHKRKHKAQLSSPQDQKGKV